MGHTTQLTVSKPKPVGPLEITTDVGCYLVNKSSEIVPRHLSRKGCKKRREATPVQHRTVATIGLAPFLSNLRAESDLCSQSSPAWVATFLSVSMYISVSMACLNWPTYCALNSKSARVIFAAFHLISLTKLHHPSMRVCWSLSLDLAYCCNQSRSFIFHIIGLSKRTGHVG